MRPQGEGEQGEDERKATVDQGVPYEKYGDSKRSDSMLIIGHHFKQRLTGAAIGRFDIQKGGERGG